MSNGQYEAEDQRRAAREWAILENFRRYTASYIESLSTAKDRIFHLLGRQGIIAEAIKKWLDKRGYMG